MSVQPGSFLTLHYRLRDGDRDGVALVDTFGTAPATLSLGTGELAPAMEARLIGMEAGSEQSFALAAGEAFGQRDPTLVHRVSRTALAAEAEGDGDYSIGDVVRFPAPDGRSIAGVVRDIGDDAIVFDFNHPLAGRPVTFDVKLIGVL